MINVEQMTLILEALPDPAFILSRSGKYVAVFGGRDKRYYHDGSGLVGLYISDLIKPEMANWFLEKIAKALESQTLLVEEYDTRGHHIGDEMIQAVASMCRSELRKTDIPCRLGGDEFVVAMPNTGQEEAIRFAKRLQARLRQELSRFSVEGAVVTMSMGVTTMTPEDHSYEDTLRRADHALYEAKRMGKDRIVSA